MISGSYLLCPVYQILFSARFFSCSEHQICITVRNWQSREVYNSQIFDALQERCIDVVRNTEVTEIKDKIDGLTLSLSNGSSIDCDFVIWATGVVPATKIWKDNCEEVFAFAHCNGFDNTSCFKAVLPYSYCEQVPSLLYFLPLH